MPSGRAAPDDVAARLVSAGARLGPGWTSRPDLARRVLSELLPEDPEGAAGLATAAEAGMVERSSAAEDDAALAVELADQSGLDADLSRWSVHVWRSYAAAGGSAEAPIGAATVAAGPGDRAEEARRALRRGIAAAGDALSRDPVVARRVLGDLLPHDAAAISVLVAAVRDGVPGRLTKDLPRLPADLVLPRLAESLTERESIASDRATWAVAVWAAALGLVDAAPTPPAVVSDSVGAETVVRAVVAPAAPSPDATQVRPVPTRPSQDAPRPPGLIAPAATPAPPRRRRTPALIAAVVLVVAAIGGGAWAATHLGVKADAGAKTVGAAKTTDSPVPAVSSTPSAAAVPALVVAAHRGGDERYPLETAPALLDAAARQGVAAETDMRWTADGVPVLVHDETVRDPMVCTGANPRPTIAETTSAVLASTCRTDASASPSGGRYPIPRVADVAAKLAANGGQWLLEIKTELTAKQEGELFDILEQNRIVDRTVLTSFSPAELAKARAEASRRGLTIRLLQFVQDTKLTPETAAANGLWAVAVQTPAVTKAYVAALHTKGLVVVEWTPNTTAAWQRSAANGVDLVLTDKPSAWQKWHRAG